MNSFFPFHEKQPRFRRDSCVFSFSFFFYNYGVETSFCKIRCSRSMPLTSHLMNHRRQYCNFKTRSPHATHCTAVTILQKKPISAVGVCFCFYWAFAVVSPALPSDTGHIAEGYSWSKLCRAPTSPDLTTAVHMCTPPQFL